MAKKTKEQTEITKQAIIEAAIDVFYEVGLSKATIKNIVDRTELTRGAFYWHFANKEEILSYLLDKTIAKYQHYFEELINESSNSIQLLSQHAINLFTTICDNERERKVFAIFMQTVGSQQEMTEFRQHSESIYFESQEFYKQQFESAKKDNLISEIHSSELLAFGYNAYITGIIDSWYASPTDNNMNIGEHAHSLIELFLAPLLKNNK